MKTTRWKEVREWYASTGEIFYTTAPITGTFVILPWDSAEEQTDPIPGCSPTADDQNEIHEDRATWPSNENEIEEDPNTFLGRIRNSTSGSRFLALRLDLIPQPRVQMLTKALECCLDMMSSEEHYDNRSTLPVLHKGFWSKYSLFPFPTASTLKTSGAVRLAQQQLFDLIHEFIVKPLMGVFEEVDPYYMAQQEK